MPVPSREVRKRNTQLQLKTSSLLSVLILATVLLMATGCQASTGGHQFSGNRFDSPLAVPDFELTQTNGAPFRFSETEGQINLIYFGYTFCPDVCPLTMVDLKEALDGLEGRERVNVIFISVDPERDTPEVLERYVKGFAPDFIGLTDDYAKIETVMQSFGAYAEKEEAPESAAGYLVNHTARVYLATVAEGIMLTYPFGFEPKGLQADLAYLLQAPKNNE